MLAKRLLLSALLCLPFMLSAQEYYHFTKGLVSGPCHQYGRQALYTDQLAYALSNGRLTPPTEGAPAFSDEKGAAAVWQSITADSAGVFSGRALNGSYIYLSYDSPREQTALLNIAGHEMVYANGAPRAGDMYRYGWMYLPVQLHKGLNHFYVRAARGWGRRGVKAQLVFPQKPVYISTADSTLPFVVTGQKNDALQGAVVIINSTVQPLRNLRIRASVQGKAVVTPLPEVAPLTTRKVGFTMDAGAIQQKGDYRCELELLDKRGAIDRATLPLQVAGPQEHYSNTFVSRIDGSVQYYSVAPQRNPDGKAPALFLSVHGAEVQAINQARAYRLKDWGVLVAPTNRRPRGFNWEDWGRLDALEVLDLAQQQFSPDPSRIYLTGHSMGGHGTWYLGATYPEKWAAIAPCSGYPTLTGYGSADGLIPDSFRNATEQLLLRSSNPSNVLAFADNYKPLGVYILHGDSDKVVSVNYARQMKQVLAGIHADFSYYEYPGGEHWYGDQCVDWNPLFDYFRYHTIKPDSAVNIIDFTTASPAISSSYYWAHILQQEHALQYSRVRLKRDRSRYAFTGTTGNVQTLALQLTGIPAGAAVTVELDGQPPLQFTRRATDSLLYLEKQGRWQISAAPSPAEKGPQRGGTLKVAFNHHMLFVYSTGGDREENEWSYNKARYDAETWYYRGNGAVDIIADKDFDAARYPDRGVVLYGNASTNKAWQQLLQDCPVQIARGKATAGQQQFTGNNLAAYFMWPRHDSKTAAVAVIGGTGLPGMRAADANQYFAGGSGFPDYMIFTAELLKGNTNAVKTAGFYGNDWQLSPSDMIRN